MFLFSVLGTHAEENRSKVAPRTIGDITALLDQYQPDPAKALAVRKILDQMPPDTQDRKDLSRFYKQKAVAAQDVGAARENVLAMRKVVELGGEWDISEDLHLLSTAELMAGNIQQALAAKAEILSRLSPGTYPGKRLLAHGTIAGIYARFGDMKRAAVSIEEAESEYRYGLGKPYASHNRHAWIFNLDRIKSLIFVDQGKLSEAESLLRHAVSEMPGVLSDLAMAQEKKMAVLGSRMEPQLISVSKFKLTLLMSLPLKAVLPKPSISHAAL